MRRVFLTGASSGIGLAIAKSLLDEGHEVWGTSRNLERIPKMPRLHAIRLDLADRLLIENAFNSALAEAGYFDVVINNAGAGDFGPAELLPIETIASQFQILVFGQIQLMQLALRHMQARGDGLVINVTSLASRLPVPFMAAYNAAKAALASFTMSIQLELGDSRVHIVDLQPADIRTEFNQGVIKSTKANPRYDTKVGRAWAVVERNIESAFNSALAEAGYFDVLINNAGAGHFGPAELLPFETITSQFQVLVFGQIQLMQLALRHMQARGGGLIINVTSLASRLPVPFMAAYNAAKAAMASFTMSIQLELDNSRVHVVDLQPADIRTEFNQGVIKSTKADPRYDTKVARTWEIVERNMKSAPPPDLVAQHVLKLVSAVQPPPRMTVGDAFQSKIAPLIFRFLPQRLRLWGLKRYYQI